MKTNRLDYHKRILKSLLSKVKQRTEIIEKIQLEQLKAREERQALIKKALDQCPYIVRKPNRLAPPGRPKKIVEEKPKFDPEKHKVKITHTIRMTDYAEKLLNSRDREKKYGTTNKELLEIMARK